MIIELKQAVQQALEALTFIRRQLKGWDQGDPVIDALRAAQAAQADAQQPATGEPVAYVDREGFIIETGLLLTPGTKLYTHPAPSGLGDSKRLDYLQDRGATIDLIAGVAAFYPMRFRVGGLHSSANIDVRAAIDAAMLAAK